MSRVGASDRGSDWTVQELLGHEQRSDDDDLHPRAKPGGPRRPQQGGRPWAPISGTIGRNSVTPPKTTLQPNKAWLQVHLRRTLRGSIGRKSAF